MKIREFISILAVAILLTVAIHVLISSNLHWHMMLVVVIGLTLLVCIVVRWISSRKERARQATADKLRMQLISFEEADRRATRDYLCGRGQYPGWRG